MIRPITDRIFIRLDAPTAVSNGGILLPEDYHVSRNTGTVESVGCNVSSVKPGERVLFHRFDDLPSHDQEVVVVKESSILGVYEND